MSFLARAVAFTTCLIILTGPVGMLGSAGALAQTAGTVEASSVRRVKGFKAKSKRPHTAPSEAHSTKNEGVAPAPASFYSAGQFADHVLSIPWEVAAVGGALVFVGVRDWDWGGSKFQFIEEGWFGNETRHGGMDKIGHAFSTYVIADILTDRIRANAADSTGASITGALIGFGFMSAVETLDGFTGKHRFSPEDIAANAFGAAFSILRNSVPGMREKLDWRIMYTPANYELPGISSWESDSIVPPYERQRYVMALKGSGFDTLKNTPLRYFELHAGFDARGFEKKERELGHPMTRTFYAGIGLNLNEILFGSSSLPNLAEYKDTLPARAVQKTFEYVQVPYTAAYQGARYSTPRR